MEAMGLADEVKEARAAVARANYALHDYRSALETRVGDAERDRTGNKLRELEQAVTDAKANFERVESDVLDRAHAIVAERDPGYADEIRGSSLVGEVEKSTFIGAADRLAST